MSQLVKQLVVGVRSVTLKFITAVIVITDPLLRKPQDNQT